MATVKERIIQLEELLELAFDQDLHFLAGIYQRELHRLRNITSAILQHHKQPLHMKELLAPSLLAFASYLQTQGIEPANVTEETVNAFIDSQANADLEAAQKALADKEAELATATTQLAVANQQVTALQAELAKDEANITTVEDLVNKLQAVFAPAPAPAATADTAPAVDATATQA